MTLIGVGYVLLGLAVGLGFYDGITADDRKVGLSGPVNSTANVCLSMAAGCFWPVTVVAVVAMRIFIAATRETP